MFKPKLYFNGKLWGASDLYLTVFNLKLLFCWWAFHYKSRKLKWATQTQSRNEVCVVQLLQQTEQLWDAEKHWIMSCSPVNEHSDALHSQTHVFVHIFI